MAVARGTFEVVLTPQQATAAEGAPALGRMVIDKSYVGELTGTGRGQMLSSMTATDGSAGYVAQEVVDATLGGKTGSFVLQHVGVMNRGDASLEMQVIPDSGTGQLAGISGGVTIDIDDDGVHHYEFTFDLAFDGATE